MGIDSSDLRLWGSRLPRMKANLAPLIEDPDDPDDPDYRYPMAGERLWHRWGCWVVVAEEQDPSDEIVGSVRALDEEAAA